MTVDPNDLDGPMETFLVIGGTAVQAASQGKLVLYAEKSPQAFCFLGDGWINSNLFSC